ncbi:MAG: 4Fe-4S binding protein, partial [Thermoguttaceae bacterium]
MKKLSPIVKVLEDKCVSCHACIAACPVKLCNIASEKVVHVNDDACIGCGSCIKACIHGARRLVDDFEPLMHDLKSGRQIVAIVAPSVISNFPHAYLKLNDWLASLG